MQEGILPCEEGAGHGQELRRMGIQSMIQNPLVANHEQVADRDMHNMTGIPSMIRSLLVADPLSVALRYITTKIADRQDRRVLVAGMKGT